MRLFTLLALTLLGACDANVPAPGGDDVAGPNVTPGPASDTPMPAGSLPSAAAAPTDTGQTCDDPDGDGVCAIDDVCPTEDDRLDNDHDGVPDCIGPTYPPVVDTLHVNMRTGLAPGDSDDVSVQLCLTETDCFDLAVPDHDMFEIDAFDVKSFSGVGLSRAEVDRVQFKARGPDDWRPACVQVAFDGEPVYCNYGYPVGFGDQGMVEWTDPLGLTNSCATCLERVSHGPVVGAVTPTTARLWLRTDVTRLVRIRLTEDPSDVFHAPVVAVVHPRAEDDFTAVVDLEGLTPDTTYHVGVEAGGAPVVPGSFRTAPPAGPARLRLALGSHAVADRQLLFAHVAARAPDAVVLLGDTHGKATADLDALRQGAREHLRDTARGALLRHTPTLATWGRDDFLGRGRDGTDPRRVDALRVFREYWANPSFGTVDTDGVFTRWSWGDIDLFLLDDRYHADELDLLGPGQLVWLLDALEASTAPFKLVGGSRPFTSEGDGSSWAAWPEERELLLDALVERGIDGVVLISGGPGRSELRWLPGSPGGYTVPLVVSSSLSGEVAAPCGETNEVVACVGDDASFVVLDVDTTVAEPALTVTLVDRLGTDVAAHTIGASELARPVHVPAPARQDIDGDGYADLPTGAPSDGLGVLDEAGGVQVFYGSTAGLHSSGESLFNQNSTGIPDQAEAGDRFGQALATGDFDGDGYADLAVGSPADSVGAVEGAGQVTVILGSPAGLMFSGAERFDRGDLGLGPPQAGDRLAHALAAGDFDDDGYDDLAVGVPGDAVGGRVVVLFGSPGGLAGAESLDLRDAADLAPQAGDALGEALAVGDLDGDGTDDLAAGLPGRLGGGAVVALFGAPGGLDTSRSVVVSGTVDAARLGHALAMGDADGDGFADLAIGAPDDPVGGVAGAGSVTVVHGTSSGLDLAGASAWHIDRNDVAEEPGADDAFGWAVALGDRDGDGYAELVVGVPGRTLGEGAVFAFPGSMAGTRSGGYAVWTQHDSVRSVAEAGDGLGSALAVRDLDGDGRVDIVVSAPHDAVDGVADVGSFTVLPGGRVLGVGEQLWHQGLDTIDGTPEAGDGFGSVLAR